MAEYPTDNQLGTSTSPYLRQHADNPVAWRPWGRAALAEAQQRGVPILLSVGYAACHWCHVMAHESFEDPDVAEVMNRNFVNIKVDREERPDIDQIYQNAHALMNQRGGWPLTMFLTPDGDPFWGGTYFPKDPRFGMPGFPDVLTKIAEAWRDQGDAVQANVQNLRDALQRLNATTPGDGVPPEAPEQIAVQLVDLVDWENGGLGGAPKFPQPQAWLLMWRQYIYDGNERLVEGVLHTLDRMCQGGLYDHLGGGFARYCVDEVWRVPHFEKMLYDNAQLVELLSHAWQETGIDLYARRATDSIAWLLADMRVADAAGRQGFASSRDADSEGIEGKFYTWTDDELTAVLQDAGFDTATIDLFRTTYEVLPAGNWEGTNVLNRLNQIDALDDASEAQLAACREALLAHRAGRTPPERDDKVLADWNGLAIAGLARAARAFDRQDWLDAAESAFAFITHNLADGERLHHNWRAGVAANPATLDDYAFLSRAAIALAEATGDWSYVTQARHWVGILDAHYWDGEAGGYFLAADDTPALIQRPKTVSDTAVPAGNGVMIEVLSALAVLTGDAAFGQRAQALVQAFAGQLGQNAFPLTSYLSGIAYAQRLQEIVVLGDRDDGGYTGLLRAVERQSLPDSLRLPLPDAGQANLPAGHPGAGRPRVDGAATAYVCQAGTCSLPVTEPAALADTLRRGRRREAAAAPEGSQA